MTRSFSSVSLVTTDTTLCAVDNAILMNAKLHK